MPLAILDTLLLKVSSKKHNTSGVVEGRRQGLGGRKYLHGKQGDMTRSFQPYADC